MPVECQDCGQKFFLQGSDLDNLVSGSGCPSCGSQAIDRDTPPGVHSDGELRNMIEPGEEDPGGNPLQEGILGDWQNRQVRDESFASVEPTHQDFESYGKTGQEHPRHPFIRGEGTPDYHLDPDFGIMPQPQYPNHPSSEVVSPESELGEAITKGMGFTPKMRMMQLPEDTGVGGAAFRPDHSERPFRAPHNPKTVLREDWPELGDQIPRDYPIRQGHTAADAFPDDDPFGGDPFGEDDPFADPTAGWSSDEPAYYVIVTGDGRAYYLPAPSTHEDVAQTNGLDLREILDQASLGIVKDDGGTEWFQNASGLAPEELGAILSRTLGEQVQVDPNLESTTNEDRWAQPNTGAPKRELEILQGPAKRRPGYMPNQLENEGLVRGGGLERTLDMEPYESLWHVSEILDQPQPDFQVEDVVPPGQHQTVEVLPEQRLGIHNGPASMLSRNQVAVNGQVHDNHEEIVQRYSPMGRGWTPNETVMLSHEDPEILEAARQSVEQGNGAPLSKLNQQREMQQTVPESAQIQLPNGFTPNVMKALGVLGLWVNGKAIQNAYKYLQKTIQPGDTVTINAANPELLQVAQQVAETDDMTPAKEYHMRSRQASIQKKAQWQAALEALGPLLTRAAPSLMNGAMSAGAGGASGGTGASMLNMVVPGPLHGLVNSADALGAFGGEEEEQPQQSATPQEDPGPRPAQLMGSYDSPAVNQGYYENDDPEDVDPHEFNDQADQGLYDPQLDAGGAQTGEIPEEGEGMGEMKRILPLLTYLYLNEDSGEGDPMVRSLHDTLEREAPGYLERSDDAYVDQLFHELAQHMGEAHTTARTAQVPNPGTSAIPTSGLPGTPGRPPTPPAQPFAQPGAQVPLSGSTCSSCGGPLSNGQVTCPNCGAQGANQTQPVGPAAQGVAPGTPNTISPPGPPAPGRIGHSGPHTLEQFQALADLLESQGRGDEIRNLLDTPEQYADDLAQIQQRDAPPQDIAPPDQPPAMPMDPNAMGAQPMPGGGMPPGMPPGMPGMPPGMPPGMDPNAMMPPGMPPPGMVAAVQRYAADSVAPKCPKCDSHTTELMGVEGDCRCHSCHNTFKAEGLVQDHPSKPRTAEFEQADQSEHHPEHTPHSDAPPDLPTRDEFNEGKIWLDTDDQPLQEGAEYEMYTPGYDVPDVVNVRQINPDEIILDSIGYNNLSHAIRVPREEMEQMQYQFTPTEGPVEPALQESTDSDPDQYTGPGQDDLSAPPQYQSAHLAQYGPQDIEMLRQMIPKLRDPMVKANFEQLLQQLEQHQQGSAPNPAVQIQAPVEESESHFGSDNSKCPKCEGVHISSNMTSPNEEEYDCYQCGHVWTSSIQDVFAGDLASREWLREDGGLVPISEPVESRNIQTLAGKHYTPLEQRDLIDEEGEARNRHKLRLDGTHYVAKEDVNEEHLLFMPG